MAKLKPDPIGEDDLIEYLDTQSDFAFELRVLNTLIEHGFSCEHSGTYDDPVTKIPREFNIRANKKDDINRILLAVECKNLRANYPLLISCVPRSDKEAFHEIACSRSIRSAGTVPMMLPQNGNAIRLTCQDSIYQPQELVGKSSSQVGRANDNSISTGDSDV